MDFVNCTIVNERTIRCNETDYSQEEGPLNWQDEWFWIYLGIYVTLVAFAGKYLYEGKALYTVVLGRDASAFGGGKKSKRS